MAGDLAVDLHPLGHVAERIDFDGHLDGHRPRELHPRRDHQAGIGGLAAAAIGSVKIVDSGVDERTPAVGAVDVTRRGGAG